MGKKIGEFQLVNHGIEHSQFFQGCGVSFTPFDNVATGIGDNPAEAIDDCLEQMAMNGWEVEGMETRIKAQEGLEEIPLTPNAYELHGSNSELHYHVSFRWNSEIATRAREIMEAERAAGLCQGCYRDPCVCLPDDCNCDPE